MQLIAEEDKTQPLATAQRFLESISHRIPPFSQTHAYIHGPSFLAAHHPARGGFILQTLTETVHRVEVSVGKILSSGAHDFAEIPAPPEPESFLSPGAEAGERIAAIWGGFSCTVDGKPIVAGVNLFSLHYISGAWTITGVADTQWLADAPMPPMSSDPSQPAVLEPVRKFLSCMARGDWDGLRAVLLSGGGATYLVTTSNGTGRVLKAAKWEEMVEDLLGKSVEFGTAEGSMQGVTVRTCGQLGFVWVPPVVKGRFLQESGGASIFTLLKQEDGKWLVSGWQNS